MKATRKLLSLFSFISLGGFPCPTNFKEESSNNLVLSFHYSTSMAPTNETFDELSSKVDAIITQLTFLTTTLSPSSPQTTTPQTTLTSHMKLDVPKFDDIDAIGWIFKISQFFTYHQTPEADILTVASFYMDGPTLSWYQWMYNNGLITNWVGFIQALENALLRHTMMTLQVPSSSLYNALL